MENSDSSDFDDPFFDTSDEEDEGKEKKGLQVVSAKNVVVNTTFHTKGGDFSLGIDEIENYEEKRGFLMKRGGTLEEFKKAAELDPTIIPEEMIKERENAKKEKQEREEKEKRRKEKKEERKKKKKEKKEEH